ncbi:MAG TPA: iron-containing alcohol dehydrogenase, partial [Ohtaekwangia sp.]
MISAFSLAATPALHFGTGKISLLPSLVKSFGPRIALVTGARSFMSSSHGHRVLETLRTNQLIITHCSIDKEPTPLMIDSAVADLAQNKPDVVVAIGGGSVLDAGKAIAAMIPLRESVKDYLEGVGTKKHSGIKIPFIAIPTTSGTGSEATKNAVLSEIGEQGFKKSLRHDKFVPDVAILDPELTLSCSPETTAASGMDAFTQLLESYLSTAANPVTDALALEGLSRIAVSLPAAYNNGNDLEARTNMAFASYLSGITLANAGLGAVHGFASSVGGYFDIPHGVICSTLMAPANEVTIRNLRSMRADNAALHKYARVGKLFSRGNNKSDDYYIDSLIALIKKWTAEMNIPKLSQFGVNSSHIEKIVHVTDSKNNPVALNK